MTKRLGGAIAALAVTGLVGGADSAQALTIDFSNFTFNNATPNGVTPNTTTLSREGFTFTASASDAFFVFGTLDPRFTGQVALHNNHQNDTTTVTRDGGGTFSQREYLRASGFFALCPRWS